MHKNDTYLILLTFAVITTPEMIHVFDFNYSVYAAHKHMMWKCYDFQMSHSTTKPTKWPVRPVKTQISLGIRIFINHAVTYSTHKKTITRFWTFQWSLTSYNPAVIQLYKYIWSKRNPLTQHFRLTTQIYFIQTDSKTCGKIMEIITPT